MGKVFKCLFFGLTFLFVSTVILLILWPILFQLLLRNNLALSPNSKSYGMWIETPLPMYLDIHLFNWTNAVEFAKNPKLKPSYKEIGPFVFREVHDRVNITWNDDGTISYNQTRKWAFVPELSVNLDTAITNVDVIALGVAHATRYSNAFVHEALKLLFEATSKVYVTKPARKWLFDGMNLVLLDVLNTNIIKKEIKFPIPDKFGFFYQRNMSSAYDGRFTVLTGRDQLSQLGDMVGWNGRNKTDFFHGDCAAVKGSSGEIFPTLSNNPSEFTLFITDVCSPLTLKYAQSKSYSGLTGKQFIGDATMFDNGQNVTERACFCEGECQPAGVRNLTRCRQGAPVFVSFPHFYLADPSYRSAIDGLSPNETLHQFQLTIDPLTGIPLDVKASLQVNVLLRDYSMYNLYKNMPKIYMPMVWFTQRAHITQDIADQAMTIHTLQRTLIIVFYVLLGVIAIALLGLIIKKFRKTVMNVEVSLISNEVVEDEE